MCHCVLNIMSHWKLYYKSIVENLQLNRIKNNGKQLYDNKPAEFYFLTKKKYSTISQLNETIIKKDSEELFPSLQSSSNGAQFSIRDTIIEKKLQ